MSSVFRNFEAENIISRFRKDKNKNIWIPAPSTVRLCSPQAPLRTGFAGMTEGALQRGVLVYT
jgi:hypothetical protein